MVKRARRRASSRPGGAAGHVIVRAQLRDAGLEEFVGGEGERSRLLRETEHDYVALVSAGAETVRLESTFERADREVSQREADSAALVITQMRELVAAVAARLPSA